MGKMGQTERVNCSIASVFHFLTFPVVSEVCAVVLACSTSERLLSKTVSDHSGNLKLCLVCFLSPDGCN